MNQIETLNLEAGYNQPAILSGLNLRFQPGQLIVLAGPNGSGKTTLLKTLAGLLKPLSGQILWNQTDLRQMSSGQTGRTFGFLSQVEPPAGGLTVREMITLGRYPWINSLFGLPEKDQKIVRDIMELLGLTELSEKSVSRLSGGEFQKVRLGRLLAQKAPVLFLDEPTLHLDIAGQMFLLKTIKNILKTELPETQPLVIVTLHDINQIIFYADRVILLSKGRIAADGPPQTTLNSNLLNSVFDVRLRFSRLAESGGQVCLPETD